VFGYSILLYAADLPGAVIMAYSATHIGHIDAIIGSTK
jgi:hypothetical protein